MKKWKKVLCLSLCLLLIFAVGDKYQIVAHAELTNDSIKQKEAEIAKAKEEKKSLQSGLTNVKELKKQLEASKSDLANYIAELDANLADIQAKIAELKEMISIKEKAIVYKTKDL